MTLQLAAMGFAVGIGIGGPAGIASAIKRDTAWDWAANVLGTSIAATIMRHTRSAMLTAHDQDYVRTARAKGLGERAVVLRPALRNTLIAVVTLGAPEFGTLLSGAVLIEQVFSMPGLGKLVVDSVFDRDDEVLQGVVMVTAALFVGLILATDALYLVLNPWLRHA